MKKASLVLGIIGGVLAVIFAAIFIAGGALMGGLNNAIASQAESGGWELQSGSSTAAAGTLWIIGIASVVGAILGIVGGILARKKGVVAGILMVAAAIPSFFTGLGIIASILFIIGGVLAFIPQKAQQKTPQSA